MNAQSDKQSNLVSTYMYLTKQVLPSLAQNERNDWPVCEDHCFQRIVLDTICGGVWYEYLSRPAYKHLSEEQALRAVALCGAIIDGKLDLRKLNRQSLIWRKKRQVIN